MRSRYLSHVSRIVQLIPGIVLPGVGNNEVTGSVLLGLRHIERIAETSRLHLIVVVHVSVQDRERLAVSGNLSEPHQPMNSGALNALASMPWTSKLDLGATKDCFCPNSLGM